MAAPTRTGYGLSGILLAIAAGGSAPAAEPPDAAARLEQTEAAITKLERELAAVRTRAEAATAPAALAPSGGGMLDGLRFHGAVSQGFAWADAPHQYLTLDTDRGSFQFTDMTLGVTKDLGRNLRVGVQLYNRNFGDLGDHRFQLDYANLDWRCHQALGVKAGRIKTRAALYNDSRDQDAGHPWVFSPFLYDATSRDLWLNHDGVDIYGNVDLEQVGLPLGQLSYTAFAGTTLAIEGEGLDHTVRSLGLELRDMDVAYLAGVDLRLIGSGLLSGLTVGSSYVTCEFEMTTAGLQQVQVIPPIVPPVLVTPIEVHYDSTEPLQLHYFYAEYEWWDLKIAAEVQLIDNHYVTDYRFPGLPRITVDTEKKSRTWYGMVAFRWSCLTLPRFQTYVYYCDHVFDRSAGYTNGANYLRDLAFGIRYDITDNWYVKAEVHDMHGWGWTTLLEPNQEGHKSGHWFMIGVKTGLSF